MEEKIHPNIFYLKIRLVLGLITLFVGLWAANLALFNWVEDISIHYLLGQYARYVCAYGGFSAIIFGSMAVNDYVNRKTSKKSKGVEIMAVSESQLRPETENAQLKQRITRERQKNMGKKAAALSLAFLLLILMPAIAYSTSLYTASLIVTPTFKAFIAYRSNTGLYGLSSPKSRIWASESWGQEKELPSAGSPVRWVRSAYCPIHSRGYELIVVTLSNEGYLDAYVWNGTSWIVENNIAFTGTTANAYRCFDIAYEKASGRALLVYSRGTTTNEIGYKIWNGTAWSIEKMLDADYTAHVIYWISLASCPGTRAGAADDNEIAMIYIVGDADGDVFGYVWTGSDWNSMGATAVWDNKIAIATEECMAVAYEQQSGRAMFIWGDDKQGKNNYRIWDGKTLSAVTALTLTNEDDKTNWVVLKAQSNSNGMLFGVVDAARDLNTAYWDGSAWTTHSEHDSDVGTQAARCFDFAWNPAGSTGLLVWGTAANSISYKTFTAPNTWSSTFTKAAAGTHLWIQLRTNQRLVNGDKYILGADLNSNFDIGSITWDGSTFTITEGLITVDTTVSTYECFDLKFSPF
ncbi:MAG: hypothetical protein QXN87_08690 [Candidatus Bathyarchaeia archaeon]